MSPLTTWLIILIIAALLTILVIAAVGDADPRMIPPEPASKYTALDRDIDEALRMVQPNPLLKSNPNVNHVPDEWTQDGAL